ncbi:lipid-A-disaccharide synthase [bacterium]|nr:lipid-A-disaccharide synthase [bacterium]
MKLYLIAGEASGDLHGANLMKALKERNPSVQFRFWGGDRMAAIGGTPVRHIRELAFMGFVEVVRNLRRILGFLDAAKADVAAWKPDALVLIDYPGFNMRMARYAHSLGIPVVYYISPQVWAWKQGRVEQLRQTVDLMLVVLPFETEFYARFGMEVHFVGHPLLDALGAEDASPEPGAESPRKTPSPADNLGKPWVALLPGSRKQEIAHMLPIFVETAQSLPQYQFAVAAAPSVDRSVYEEFIGQAPIELWEQGSYSLLQKASAALVASGTATLETALFRVPQIVCYRANPLSVWIARRLIKVPYISLVNLVLNREAVKELIQSDLHPKALRQNLQGLFEDAKRKQIDQDYTALAEALGGPGASHRAARAVLELFETGRNRTRALDGGDFGLGQRA